MHRPRIENFAKRRWQRERYGGAHILATSAQMNTRWAVDQVDDDPMLPEAVLVPLIVNELADGTIVMNELNQEIRL